MTLLGNPAARDVVTTPSPGASLAELARADEVRFILATFTTLAGKPCSKLVPVHAAEVLQSEGVGFAGYAAGTMGQRPQDPDIMVIPDVASYTPLPSVRPGLAMVHCDPHVEGKPYPFAPRVILRRQVELAAARGLSLQAGAEVEYFLVQREPDGSIRIADRSDSDAQPCYDARGVTRMYDHLTGVADTMADLGWGPYASDHEDGNGQFEQNFTHSDALTTADRVVTLRYLIQVLAEQRGMIATFMPKPFTERTGSGLHLHLSVWRDGRPTFPLQGHEATSSVSPVGLSELAGSFIAGILDHAPALHALIAPTVNSYKRTGATTTTSGATWTPRRTASWGGNDRTHLIRVPDAQRLELRGGDGSANPYLAVAGAVAAGLDGLDRALDPGAPGDLGSGALLPRTLLDAVHALEGDAVVRGVLDAVDERAGVSAYYAELKREEFYAWHSTVSPWEVDRYLTSL